MSDVDVLYERVVDFERYGGVDVAKLEPEEKHLILGEVRTGLVEHKRARFVFRCPICGNRFENDQALEPLCTGPNAALDEHPHEPMVRVDEEPTVKIAGFGIGV